MGRRTASLWGAPPKRFYSFVSRVEREFSTASGILTYAVLGCSDGKFVLPITRRGHKVVAVDIDSVALYGGVKVGPSGEVKMPGLVARLAAEGQLANVDVLNADFIEVATPVRCHGVFTSGSLQYSHNLKHSSELFAKSLSRWLTPGGLLYVDYMLPLEPHHHDRFNFYEPGILAAEFQKAGTWSILYDKVVGVIPERGHVDMPTDHFHRWGRLCLRYSP